jgi:hypothetical protein
LRPEEGWGGLHFTNQYLLFQYNIDENHVYDVEIPDEAQVFVSVSTNHAKPPQKCETDGFSENGDAHKTNGLFKNGDAHKTDGLFNYFKSDQLIVHFNTKRSFYAWATEWIHPLPREEQLSLVQEHTQMIFYVSPTVLSLEFCRTILLNRLIKFTHNANKMIIPKILKYLYKNGLPMEELMAMAHNYNYFTRPLQANENIPTVLLTEHIIAAALCGVYLNHMDYPEKILQCLKNVLRQIPESLHESPILLDTVRQWDVVFHEKFKNCQPKNIFVKNANCRNIKQLYSFSWDSSDVPPMLKPARWF